MTGHWRNPLRLAFRRQSGKGWGSPRNSGRRAAGPGRGSDRAPDPRQRRRHRLRSGRASLLDDSYFVLCQISFREHHIAFFRPAFPAIRCELSATKAKQPCRREFREFKPIPIVRFSSQGDVGRPGSEGMQVMEIGDTKEQRVKLESEKRAALRSVVGRQGIETVPPPRPYPSPRGRESLGLRASCFSRKEWRNSLFSPRLSRHLNPNAVTFLS